MPDIHAIKPQQRGLSDEDRDKARRYLEDVLSFFPNDLAAIAIVGIGLDGSFSRGTKISQQAFFGHTLLPAIVEEILRRDVMEDVATGALR